MTDKPAASLQELRVRIDALDSELVTLLARRQRCVEEVIAIKQARQLPARIPERVDEVLAHVRELALERDLAPELAVAVWREMIEQFIAFEERALTG